MDVTAGRRGVQAPWRAAHPLGALRAWNAARGRRHDADRQIAAGVPTGFDLAWRADELTSPRERRLLAHSVRATVGELSGRTLPGSSPLNRRAVRPYSSLLVVLADLLADLGRPVSAAGVLAVRSLLTEPDSVLYVRPALDEQPSAIGAELRAILDSLEVRS